MRPSCRGLMVGVSFVLVAIVSACQAAPAPSGSTVPSVVTATVEATAAVTPTVVADGAVETGTLTETAKLTETVELTVTVEITSTEITESTELTATDVVTSVGEVTSTVGVTATSEVTGVSEVASTEVITADTAMATDPALLEAGLAVYRAQYCGVCHKLDAAETSGTFGPTHNDLAATVDGYFANGIYIGKATTPAEYVLESIVDPQAFIVPGFATTSHRMPSYTHLDEASLDALVAFLLAH